MVEDDPEDLVQDMHMEQTLKGHPLGRPILGETSVIRGLRGSTSYALLTLTISQRKP